MQEVIVYDLINREWFAAEAEMERKRLLVVDEEPEIGTMLSEGFAEQFDVLKVRSWEEAIRRAVCDHPSCILLDVFMPEVGGSTLCEILKSIKQIKLIPIILMGTKPRYEVWALAQEKGAFDYIEKPFSFEKASDAVHRALDEAPLERRRAPRVSMKIPIVIRGKDNKEQDFELHAETVDVSRYGALVRLPVRIPVGKQVELCPSELPSTNGNDDRSTAARIVWNDEKGAIGPYWHGLEFVLPSSEWVINQ